MARWLLVFYDDTPALVGSVPVTAASGVEAVEYATANALVPGAAAGTRIVEVPTAFGDPDDTPRDPDRTRGINPPTFQAPPTGAPIPNYTDTFGLVGDELVPFYDVDGNLILSRHTSVAAEIVALSDPSTASASRSVALSGIFDAVDAGGLVNGPSAGLGLGLGSAYFLANDAAGQLLGGFTIDRYGLHLDGTGGATSPSVFTSNTFANAAPAAIPAANALQEIAVYDVAPGTGGSYTLNDDDHSYAMVISNVGAWDDQATVQATFDAAYGAGEVTITGDGGGFTVDYSPGTLAGTRLSPLRVSADSLTEGPSAGLHQIRVKIDTFGKALGLDAAPGSTYQRNNAGVGELWMKQGATPVDWVQVI